MKSIKTILLRCPCCKEIRSYDNFKHLIEWHSQYKSAYILSPVESAEQGFLQWACDKCMKEKRAIEGKPEKQSVKGITQPLFAYYNQERKCANCGDKFIFTKEEQQYWYEELKFTTWSDAKDCKKCRKESRKIKERNTKISNLIKDLKPDNLNQIEILIQLYLEINKIEKAKYFLAVGRKNVKDKNNNETKERLERIEEKIAAHTK